MKIKIVLAAVFALIFSTAVYAQDGISAAVTPADKQASKYSGKWTLDVEKSKLGERSRVESMTMTVEQTEKELKVESSVKRVERPDGEPRRGGMPNSGGMEGMRGGGGFGGDSTTLYTLDGKGVTTDMAGAMGGKLTAKAVSEKDGKLKLEQTREIETPQGARRIKTTETWSLSADGKTLTVKRDTENPRGTNSTEMIFTKQ